MAVRRRDIDDASCSHVANASEAAPATASLPFWPLPVTNMGSLMCSIYSDHSPKTRGMEQTDRQTNGRTTASQIAASLAIDGT